MRTSLANTVGPPCQEVAAITAWLSTLDPGLPQNRFSACPGSPEEPEEAGFQRTVAHRAHPPALAQEALSQGHSFPGICRSAAQAAALGSSSSSLCILQLLSILKEVSVSIFFGLGLPVFPMLGRSIKRQMTLSTFWYTFSFLFKRFVSLSVYVSA